MAKNELIKLGDNYPILASDINEVLADNLGTEGLDASDLDRVKVPNGGGVHWTLETLEGEEAVKELKGIIVMTKMQRVYWAQEFSGGGDPPDCYSADGLVGHGDPGGQCAKCPWAQFGSAEKSNAQACQARRLVFMLMENSALPVVVNVPPTSLKPLKKYLVKLGGQGIHAHHVVTSLTLEKCRNKSGVDYAEVRCQGRRQSRRHRRYQRLRQSHAPDPGGHGCHDGQRGRGRPLLVSDGALRGPQIPEKKP